MLSVYNVALELTGVKLVCIDQGLVVPLTGWRACTRHHKGTPTGREAGACHGVCPGPSVTVAVATISPERKLELVAISNQ